MYILSLCFYASNAYRILLSIAYYAIILVTEVIIGIIFVNIFTIPFELFYENTQIYMYGMLTSNLLVLFLVLMTRVFIKGNKYDSGKQFNILITFMPIQSIIICYLVIDYSIKADMPTSSPTGVIAVILSISLIFIMMFILSKQRKAMIYKRESELNKTRLDMQLEHYKEIYQEQQRVKSMRHDMNNNLFALSGILNAGNVHDAIEKINEILNEVVKVTDIVDTGNPPIDAILSVKTTKAIENGIMINHTVVIDGELYVDQFDIALIIANALDNAIEGIQRSTDIDKTIALSINRVSEYISILIENNASGPVYSDYQTSKPDKKNHGFGMTQMKDIVQKYNGSFRPLYDEETKRFLLKIMLENKQV